MRVKGWIAGLLVGLSIVVGSGFALAQDTEEPAGEPSKTEFLEQHAPDTSNYIESCEETLARGPNSQCEWILEQHGVPVPEEAGK